MNSVFYVLLLTTYSFVLKDSRGGKTIKSFPSLRKETLQDQKESGQAL